MVDRATYRHLHIRRLGVASTEFRAVGGGTEKGIPPIENRGAHAVKLAAGLDRAVAQMDAYRAAQRDAGVPANKRGLPITIEGRPNVPLRAGQARSGGGFGLLNVRRHSSVTPESSEDVDQATFFVTPSTLETFRRNLESYGSWLEPVSGDTTNLFDEDDDDGSGAPGASSCSRAPRRCGPPHFWTFGPTGSIDILAGRAFRPAGRKSREGNRATLGPYLGGRGKIDGELEDLARTSSIAGDDRRIPCDHAVLNDKRGRDAAAGGFERGGNLEFVMDWFGVPAQQGGDGCLDAFARDAACEEDSIFRRVHVHAVDLAG
jgi:hypothetical protein